MGLKFNSEEKSTEDSNVYYRIQKHYNNEKKNLPFLRIYLGFNGCLFQFITFTLVWVVYLFLAMCVTKYESD